MVSLKASVSTSTSWPAACSCATSAGSKRLSSFSDVVSLPQVRPSNLPNRDAAGVKDWLYKPYGF